MKQKKERWLLLLLLAFSLSVLQAQTFLNVEVKSGTQTSFALSDLKKLTFTSAKMAVIPKTGTHSDFAIPDIHYLDFTNTTSIRETKKNARNNGLKLFPNPVQDILQIEYESGKAENVLIQILDVQGKVLYQNNLPNQMGVNNIYIPVETFRKGLYLCRIKHGTRLEFSRFIKL